MLVAEHELIDLRQAVDDPPRLLDQLLDDLTVGPLLVVAAHRAEGTAEPRDRGHRQPHARVVLTVERIARVRAAGVAEDRLATHTGDGAERDASVGATDPLA